MRVYEVELVCDKFKALDVDRTGYGSNEAYNTVFSQLRFRGDSKQSWTPPKMHYRNPLKPDPDFWMLLTDMEAFAVGPEALKTVFYFLEMAGEMLPVTVRGKNLPICNVLRVYDCIDQDRSEWRTIPGYNQRGPLKTPIFVPEHMQESTLFKIPERLHTIYCWEEDGDPETEFKARVEKHKLKGLKFELVWSDEGETA